MLVLRKREGGKAGGASVWFVVSEDGRIASVDKRWYFEFLVPSSIRGLATSFSQFPDPLNSGSRGELCRENCSLPAVDVSGDDHRSVERR